MHVCDEADAPSWQKVTWALLLFLDTPSMEFSFPYTPDFSWIPAIVDSPQPIKSNYPLSLPLRLFKVLNSQFTFLDKPLIE
jgi:hypothetical protein